MLELDHLAVVCTTLEEGAEAVERALGVPLEAGGRHPAFGTHNRLLSLGPDEYLEVIAIDPAAPPPGRSRWFGLDHFAGPPRLGNWIVRCDSLADEAPADVGQPMALERGDYRWSMAIPDNGLLPFDNLHPAMIAWHGPHPAAALPDRGCRLSALVVTHPDAQALAARLKLRDSRVSFEAGPPGLVARITTPSGMRSLG